MTLQKAAKKALEALIWCEPSWVENPKGFKRWSDAMPVLREAIERPEWVGLTYEELHEIYLTTGTVHYKFALVEAKLKEKNT